MTQAWNEFKEMVSLNEEDAEQLYEGLATYQAVSMQLSNLEGKIMAKVMQAEILDEVKYIGLHALAGSTLDYLIKGRIDYLEGKPSEFELYLKAMEREETDGAVR